MLSRDQGFSIPPSRYDRDPFDSYPQVVDAGRFPFPVDQDRVGDQLKLSEIVVSVRVRGTEKAYPLGQIGDAAINDEIEGQPVVVFSRQNGPFAAGFSAVVDGRTLTFTVDSSTDGVSYIDDQTKTLWDVTGRAVQGELSGKRLNALPSRRAMWFSISIAQPDIEVYLP